MRRLLLGGWIAFVPVAALAQPVTPADLEGNVLEARLVVAQQIRREGREFPVEVHQQLRFVFRPERVVEWSMIPVSHTPRGVRQGPTQTGRVAMNKVVDARGPGGGQAIWLFEDGTLTTLRTFGGDGGFKRTISFTREGNGFACSLKSTFMREEGVGRIATRSVIDNVPLTILSARQVSSSCRIAKNPAT
ncbi:MAG: hypothetical protein ABW198_09170 [Pseudorhodoplanes sp.]